MDQRCPMCGTTMNGLQIQPVTCRGFLGGITGRASREELIQHLALHRRQIEARLEAIEQNRPPSAEGRPRHRGPGDRAA